MFFGLVIIIVLLLVIRISYRSHQVLFPRRDTQENFTEAEVEQEVEKEISEGSLNADKQKLITNGSFEMLQDIKQMTEKEGGNYIIEMSNPGSSSNVLQQTQMNKENDKAFPKTFYMLQLSNLLPKRSYYIEAFVYQTPDWDGKDFLFNILMQPANTSFFDKAVLKSGDGELIEQVRLANGVTWDHVQFKFNTPENFNGVMQIYLGYNPDNSVGFRYLTGINMHQYLDSAKTFPISSNLQLFLSGANCNSFNSLSSTWKDISGNSNDFKWNIKPKFYPSSGQFLLDGYSAVGPHAFRLLYPPYSIANSNSSYQNQFTLIIDPQIQATNSIDMNIRQANNQVVKAQVNKVGISSIQNAIDKAFNPNNIKITDDDRLLLLFDGNRSAGLAIFWPQQNGGKIKMIIADQLYETPQSINPNNNLTFTFMFTGTNFVIFEGNSVIFNEKCSPIYFKEKPVRLNPNPLNPYTGFIRYIIFFNRVLQIQEINQINTYMKTHDKATDEDCATEIRPNITNYTLQVPSNVIQQAEQSHGTNGSSLDCTGLQAKLDKVKRAVDLRTTQGQQLSVAQKAKIQQEEEDKILTSADKSCLVAQKAQGSDFNPYDPSLGPNCPRMFLDNGNYVIYVVKGSDLEKIYGRAGQIVLGKDETSAQKIYAMNHPSCVKQPVPQKKGESSSNGYCPFVIQKEYNPCNCSGCDGVDWTKNPLTQFIPDKCKQSVRNYCEAYADIEGGKGQACYYWGEGKDEPDARVFRSYFGEMDKCDFSNADIGHHPDMDKYIRKDLVSSVCASCPLDTYEQPSDPRGSVMDQMKKVVPFPF